MAGSIYDWSLVASDNQTADGDIDWREGQLPSTVNNSARMMMTRFAEWLKDQGVLSAGGTANALTVTATSPFNTLETGIQMRIKVAATNTGAATLNANGLGSKKLRKKVRGTTADQDLAAGDLQQSHIYTLVYDGAADSGAGGWMVLDPEVTDFSLAPAIHAAAAKATPADADELPISDSAASWGLKKLTWTNIKAALKAYLDSFYLKSAGLSVHASGDPPSIAAISSQRATIEINNGGNNFASAVIGFHRVGSFGAYFGLDADNQWKVGGWSMAGVAYRLWHEGNDGAGSGLDADLLDGQQGAYYRDLGNATGTLSASKLEGGNNLWVRLSGTLNPATAAVMGPVFQMRENGSATKVIQFARSDGAFEFGSIQVVPHGGSSGSTSYNTTSDYRLKTDVTPLENSGDFIDSLRPVSFTWRDGPRAMGFLAHEFGAVAQNSVTGLKDETDESGKPVYQGIDAGTPEVIANIVAEIQALRRRVSALEVER